MTMRIAVTGARGFVGRAVMARLAAEGLGGVALNRDGADGPDARAIGELGAGPIDPAVLSGVDCVIHLAARAHSPADAGDTIDLYRRTNVEGTRALLDAARAAGVRRFIYVSSIKAVGERSPPAQALNPASPLEPEDAYGITKREAEALVRESCDAAGMEWVIVRPPLVYGPGVKANFQRLMVAVQRGLPLPLGAVRNRRSLLYVGNLAAALVHACRAPGAVGQVLMLADTTLSTPDLLRAIGVALDRKPRLLPVPPVLLVTAGTVLGKRAEIRRLLESLEVDARSSWDRLGHQPEYSTEQGLRETAAALLRD